MRGRTQYVVIPAQAGLIWMLYGGTMMDDSPHPRLALWAMTSSAVESRFANVRFGILPSQSCLGGNDGKERQADE
jgi:hypothetical protein